jgi:SAM-dependent methyltransferase
MTPSLPIPPLADPLEGWLQGHLGRLLIDKEIHLISRGLEQVFGTTCVQIGQWGAMDAFLAHARLPRRVLVAEPGACGDCVSHAAALPLASQSIDAVLLPHTLEFELEPHGVLREVERVLVGEGHVLILGFAPFGSWALRHHLTPAGFPPGVRQFLSARRLGDWLRVLGFEVLDTQWAPLGWPLESPALSPLVALSARLAPLFGGRLGSVYLLKAKKRVYTLTPIRPRRRAPRVLGQAVVGST